MRLEINVHRETHGTKRSKQAFFRSILTPMLSEVDAIPMEDELVEAASEERAGFCVRLQCRKNSCENPCKTSNKNHLRLAFVSWRLSPKASSSLIQSQPTCSMWVVVSTDG